VVPGEGGQIHQQVIMHNQADVDAVCLRITHACPYPLLLDVTRSCMLIMHIVHKCETNIKAWQDMTALLQGVAEMHKAPPGSARMLWVNLLSLSILPFRACLGLENFVQSAAMVPVVHFIAASLQAAFYAGMLTSWWLFMAVATAHQLSMLLSSS